MNPLISKILRIFSASVVGKVCHLAVSIVAARLLLPEGFGAFAFALGASFLGARIAGLGWPDLSQNLLPKYRSSADWQRFRGALLSSILLVLLGGVIVSTVFFTLANVVDLKSELRPGLMFASVLTPLIALRILFKNLLAALGKATHGVILDEALPPAVMLLTAVASLFQASEVNLETLLLSYAAGSLGSVLVGLLLAARAIPREAYDASSTTELRSWGFKAGSNLIGNISRLATNRSDVIFLAPLASLGEVGLYSAALRLTYAQTTPSSALSSFYTAKISESLATKSYENASSVFRYSVLYSGAAALPFSIAFFFFGKAILDVIYGESFINAALILTILGVSQLLSAMVIPMSALLMMSDEERTYGKVSIIAFLTSALANVILIPIYGATGAAAATLLATSLLSALLASACFRVLKSQAKNTTGA